MASHAASTSLVQKCRNTGINATCCVTPSTSWKKFADHPSTSLRARPETLTKAWVSTIAKSEALKKYAQSRGALFAPLYGAEAQKAVFPAVQGNAWLLYDTKKAKVAPDTVGIPRP